MSSSAAAAPPPPPPASASASASGGSRRTPPLDASQVAELNAMCESPKYDQFRNKHDESPCVVASRLVHLCDDPVQQQQEQAPYEVVALDMAQDQDHYPPPSAAQASDCLCNLPTYNVFQTCAACQTGPIRATEFAYWLKDCQRNFTSFPLPLPDGVSIPQWANVMNNSTNSSAAVAFYFRNISRAGVPNTTAQAPLPAPPPPAIISINPAPQPETPPAKGTDSSVLIIGGVVGLIALALLSGAAYWYRKRHLRRTRLQQQHLLPSHFDLIISSSRSGGGSISEMEEYSDKMGNGSRSTLSTGSGFVPSQDLFSTGASRSSGSFTTNSSSSRSSLSETDNDDDYPISLSSNSTRSRQVLPSRFTDSSCDRDRDEETEGEEGTMLDLHDDILSLNGSDIGAGTTAGRAAHPLSPFSDHYRSRSNAATTMMKATAPLLPKTASIGARNNILNRRGTATSSVSSESDRISSISRNGAAKDDAFSLRSTTASSTGAVYGGLRSRIDLLQDDGIDEDGEHY